MPDPLDKQLVEAVLTRPRRGRVGDLRSVVRVGQAVVGAWVGAAVGGVIAYAVGYHHGYRVGKFLWARKQRFGVVELPSGARLVVEHWREYPWVADPERRPLERREVHPAILRFNGGRWLAYDVPRRARWVTVRLTQPEPQEEP